MKKTYLLIIFIIVVILIIVLVPIIKNENIESVVCTMEAKLCSDGSYVGRSGPKCEFSACPNIVVSSNTIGDISLAIGETDKIGEVSVRLNALMQDSRCPIDVICIQVGSINVSVILTDQTHTETKNLSSGEAPYQFGQYEISIIDIAPLARSQVQIEEKEYRITFHIEKIDKTNQKTSEWGILTGRITISPTCPVERIPPDPTCAPKPYPVLVDISGIHNFFVEVLADGNGVFRLELLPGTYSILTRQTSIYPACEEKIVTVSAGVITTTDISCDSGIR